MGKGSYGVVYRCRVNGDDNYALKAVPLSGLPEAVTEVAILTTFRHDYLLHTLHRPQLDTEELAVIVPLAVGDLRARLRGGDAQPLDPTLALRWGVMLCDALSALHTHGILHGDVKPANILIYPDDRIRLADFTMALQKSRRSQGFTHRATTITYRAPEALLCDLTRGAGFLAHGRPRFSWDERVDCYALGCILYELVTGRGVFANPDGDKRTQQLLTLRRQLIWTRSADEAESLEPYLTAAGDLEALAGVEQRAQLAAVTDPQVCDLIAKLMRMHPRRRYTAVAALAHPAFRAHQNLRVSYQFVDVRAEPPRPPEARIVGAEAARLGVDGAAALGIFSQVPDIPLMNRRERAVACARIAGIVAGQDLRRPAAKRVRDMLLVLESIEFRVLRSGEPPGDEEELPEPPTTRR